MDTQFYSLRIQNIAKETHDAKTIYFDIPSELTEKFAYKAGQYLTLRFKIKGKEERRAYSLSTSPHQNLWGVSVKQVEKGIVSTHINTHLKVGDVVEVMPPQGHFTLETSPTQRKTYYVFGAGSGITPLMSLMRTVLEDEPTSEIHLLYGNRNEDEIMFRDNLASLENKYAGQLTVTHILSQPKREKAGGLGGLFSKGKITWQGLVGRADEKNVEKFLTEKLPLTKESFYLICGPGGMNEGLKSYLERINVHKEAILIEHFASKSEVSAAETETNFDTAEVTVMLKNVEYKVSVKRGTLILDTLIAQKIDAPYSCTSGACSTCVAKLTDGQVKMRACFALDDDEIAKGFVLVCQAVPMTAHVALDFDDV